MGRIPKPPLLNAAEEVRLAGAYHAGGAVSKTALKRPAGEDLPGVIAELEDAGAVEVTHSESLREVGGR